MANYSFTIITPCYNGEQYITKCIEAIANANYDHDLIEHIVVDDGSNDRTKEICTQLAQKYKHLKFYSKPNGNWGSVINYVKENQLAHNDYVLICDSDDYLLPEAFNRINKGVKGADAFSASFFRWKGKKAKTYVQSYYTLRPRTLKNNQTHKFYSPLFCVQTGVIRKEIFYKSPKLVEKVSFQDTILYNSWIQNANTIRYSFKPISVYWCQRPGNSMSEFKQQEGNRKWVENFKQFTQYDWIDPFVCYLLGNKSLRKYLKENNLKFHFATKKLHLKYLPAFTRPIFRLLYLIQVKKFVN